VQTGLVMVSRGVILCSNIGGALLKQYGILKIDKGLLAVSQNPQMVDRHFIIDSGLYHHTYYLSNHVSNSFILHVR